MKQHFEKLFKYDGHTNLAIIELIQTSGNDAELVKIMAHVLGAQQVWLTRCKGETPAGVVVWPDWSADKLKTIAEENTRNWLAVVQSLTGADFDRILNYKTSSGHAFSSSIADILIHVINHGTHHRAQIGWQLKNQGHQLPITDYIFYLRETM